MQSTEIKTTQTDQNWLYTGTSEAWLHYDYSEGLASTPCYTSASTTAYKIPDYAEDVECYDCSNPLKSSEEIWKEVEEFITYSDSSEHF